MSSIDIMRKRLEDYAHIRERYSNVPPVYEFTVGPTQHGRVSLSVNLNLAFTVEVGPDYLGDDFSIEMLTSELTAKMKDEAMKRLGLTGEVYSRVEDQVRAETIREMYNGGFRP